MTSSSTLTTFRYARTMYAPRAARIWHSFILIQTYVEKKHFLVSIDGFHAMSHIRCRRSSNATSVSEIIVALVLAQKNKSIE